MVIASIKDMTVYKKSYQQAMAIYYESKGWPRVENYSLTDQSRRSSRSVPANLREAWAKRRYRPHFLSKLSDCDAENSETDTWLDIALDCGYLSEETHARLVSENREIGRMLGAMIKTPDPFLFKECHGAHIGT